MSEEAPAADPVEGGEEAKVEEEAPTQQAEGEGTTEAKQDAPAEATQEQGEEKPATPAADTQGEGLETAATEETTQQEATGEGEEKVAEQEENKPEDAPAGDAPVADAPAEGQTETAKSPEAEAEGKTASPAPEEGEKPAEEGGEAKPATPQAGSKPASPKGSKPGTPTQAEGTEQAPAAGSKPGSPAPEQAAEGTAADKPATPAEQAAAAGSKPATPAEQAAVAGSKPATPAEQAAAAGSKPATPTEQVTAKPPTPPQAGSKPATPQAVASKPATPGEASRPPTQPQPQMPPPPPTPPIGPAAAATKSALKDEKASTSAMNLTWSFGVNKNVPVLNLTDDLRRTIMYPCANAGIIYDIANNDQIILQGHSNDIKCTCTSHDKRWVATADVGPDNMIIVWDSYTGVPVRTIFEPYPDSGVLAIAMTPDAKYIATLSASDKQTLAIWDWTVEGEVPVCSTMLNPKYGVQNYVLFNPEDVFQLVTNSDSQVIFYSWSEGGPMELQAPPLSDEDFNKPVGKYSQSIFQSGCARALTATSIGNLVVWDTVRPAYGKEPKKAMPEKKALKLVRLQERGINVLTTTEEGDSGRGAPLQKFIVAGDVLGHVKFLDQTLKLVNWYQDLHLGPINSLSFAHWPDFAPDIHSAEYPKDATNKSSHFVVRDFVIGSIPAVYAHMKIDGTDIEIIHRDHDAAVHALSAHPCRHHIVIGSYSGLLKIWDYQKKEALVSRWFDKGLMIRCCTYDQSGNYIAVGFTNGSLRVVDALTLNDILSQPFRYARDAITHVAFSHNGKYLATADAEYTVSVFKKQSSGEPWVYLGRNRAHYKLILDLCFGVHLDSDAPRLLSLGEDRVLVEYAFDGNMPLKVEDIEVEYDLETSALDDLRVASADRIEQSAVPQCMAWYPPVTAEFFIVTANDQFKFKLYNATTKMCRKTLLGPTYGTPVQKIVILPTDDPSNNQRYLAYVTSDKIGIHKLPLDGNPHNAMALIAHPQGVSNLVSSFDGKHMFTAGGSDCTVHMWDINIRALEAQSKLGGDDLIPFYGLLEGGRDGDLYKELEDYFYYAQIRSQGVDTQDSRRVSTHVPLSEIPFVMRAMGFYPSEQEIEDMLNEVRYSRYVETGQYMTEIELGDFIKLYINHRPAFGLQADKIDWAFRVLGMESPEGPMIDRGDLLDMLQSYGEHLTEEQLAEYLTTLLGYNPEGGSSELGRFDATTAGDIIEDNLPHDVTAEMFANELLGFGMYNEMLMDDGEGGKLVEGQAG